MRCVGRKPRYFRMLLALGLAITIYGNLREGTSLAKSEVTNGGVSPQASAGRTLVVGSLAGALRFDIMIEPESYLGRRYVRLKVEVARRADVGGGGGSSFVPQSGPFVYAGVTGCVPRRVPRRYVVLYGLLRARGDTVIAEIDGRSRSFSRVRLPKAYRRLGVLAYAILRTLPERVFLRTPMGETIDIPQVFYPIHPNPRECREGAVVAFG